MSLPSCMVRLGWLALFLLGSVPPSNAQDVPPLRLQGVNPGGVRTTATEADGVLQFSISNDHPEPRHIRVVVFYQAAPETHYARDLWVPGKSTANTWMPMGPAPEVELSEEKINRTAGRSVEFLLFDRTGGRDVLILPTGDEKVRARAVPYRKRELTTALCADVNPDPPLPNTYPARVTSGDEAVLLARVFREASSQSFHVALVPETLLPPTLESFSGIDQFILASNRLRPDTPGLMSLRHWLQQGGKLWIRLDIVDPDVVAALLGDDLSYSIADRVSLTSITVKRARDGAVLSPNQDYERPVDMVRVLLHGDETVLHAVNGWPATFTRPVGRGKVVFTTLGARGWFRERTSRDGRSPFNEMPNLPTKLDHLEQLASELRPPTTKPAFSVEDFRPLLTEEIGYSIVSQRTALFILLGFVGCLLVVGLLLRRSAHPERVGWVGPLFAGLAAVAFIALGMKSRQAVPPTVASVQMVDAVPGNGEAAVTGLFAVYRPASGEVPLKTEQIGALDLDTTGMEGQTRRRIQTDVGGWYWEKLALPAGVRMGPFRLTTKPGPLRATGRFTNLGLEGTVQSQNYANLADAMLLTPMREPMGVRFLPEQRFVIGPEEDLGPGQFLAGTVLTDQQQRRQAIYQKLLTPPVPEFVEERTMLFVWANSQDSPFHAGDDIRTTVTTLLQLPLELERTPSGSPVFIPKAFIPFRRIVNGQQLTPTMEAGGSVNMEIRFQLPATVLPLTIQQATLTVRARAPGRKLTISGLDGATPTMLQTADSPADPVRVVITDAKFLNVDEQGGVRVQVAISGGGDSRWKIESLTLDVQGQIK